MGGVYDRSEILRVSVTAVIAPDVVRMSGHVHGGAMIVGDVHDV